MPETMEGKVAIQNNLITVQQLCHALQIDDALVTKAEASGITMTIQLTAIELLGPNGEKTTIPIKMAALTELVGGKAAPILKQALHQNITTAYEKMIAVVANGGSKVAEATTAAKPDNPFLSGGAKPNAPSAAKPSAKSFDDGNPNFKGEVKVLTKEEIAQLAPVKLATAQAMYQPVLGTSAGSKYFVVALRDDLKIAARIKGGSLSVRVEGIGYAKYKSLLNECEFQVHSDYASIHLDTNGPKLASRALGALIASTNLHFQTPTPVLAMIGG